MNVSVTLSNIFWALSALPEKSCSRRAFSDSGPCANARSEAASFLNAPLPDSMSLIVSCARALEAIHLEKKH
jgi:hypothetical protein